MKQGHSIFIIEFGAGYFKEIMCKVLRKSMGRKKSGSNSVSYLNGRVSIEE